MTCTPEKSIVLSGMRVIFGKLTMGTYAAGGEAWPNAKIGMLSQTEGVLVPGAGYVLEFDRAAQKMKALYGDYSEASDGPLVEVAGTPDLSTAIANQPFIAFGW